MGNQVWIPAGIRQVMTVEEQKEKGEEKVFKRFETIIQNLTDTANFVSNRNKNVI